jgi:NTP pyrophosphatase (non-canonical NTP hydrolase)
MDIGEFQKLIERIYYERDSRRGPAATFRWLVEEVGELARAARRGERAQLEEEFADTLAWLSTLASLHGIDLEAAARQRYGLGCPKCRKVPCDCGEV